MGGVSGQAADGDAGGRPPAADIARPSQSWSLLEIESAITPFPGSGPGRAPRSVAAPESVLNRDQYPTPDVVVKPTRCAVAELARVQR